MQLPAEGSSINTLRRFNAYTVRRLRRASMAAPAEDCVKAIKKLREAQAAVEDALEPAEEALADRDAADDDLDGANEEANRELTSRIPEAKKKSPWKDIYPNGSVEYAAAPVGEELDRYKLFKQRLTANLPPDDPLVVRIVPRIDQGLLDWAAAEEKHKEARRIVDTRRGERDRLEQEWRTLMDRLYSSIRAERGAAAAEKFFKKQPRRGKKDDDESIED